VESSELAEVSAAWAEGFAGSSVYLGCC